MIKAYELNRALKEIENAKRIAAQEAPNAEFVLVGIDEEFVYFNVVCRLSKITPEEIRDLVAKTRFIPITVSMDPHYKGEFKMGIM